MAAANVEPGLLETEVDKPKSLPTVAAYRHTKTLARQQKAAATSVHWQVRPGAAAEIHAFDGWQHQALACRATPHPLDGAMCRWPDSGHKVGGPNGPQDGRQHHLDFGYREGREKKAWMPNAEVPQGAAVSLSLTDIKAALTKRFGSLLLAYNRMDFFKDGFLSPIEWQEGIHIIFHSFKGEDSVRYCSLCEPRPVFNRRMQELFKFMDVNGDALISFEEFSGCVQQPVERPRELIELLHPEELPGFDPQNFSDGCGPGYLKRGPDHFSNVGDSSHPIRGASWRGGAAQSRSERFAPVIPSFQGRMDRELSAASFLNHAGHRPSEGVFCGPSGHGATSVAARGGRMGKTMGSADSAGMMVPKP
mmetsp:Transcript_37892/g.100970  ORF Transcript_37892/g.100970 Transcript_37892/m.100970 type:complete len:363 (-) Transcript_37892:138-1226(-)